MEVMQKPLSTILHRLQKEFATGNPRLVLKYGKDFPDLCEVHTTLVPFLGGITTFGLFHDPIKNYHKTPQEMSAAVRAAVETYQCPLQ
jgi:hypothetical protein